MRSFSMPLSNDADFHFIGDGSVKFDFYDRKRISVSLSKEEFKFLFESLIENKEKIERTLAEQGEQDNGR